MTYRAVKSAEIRNEFVPGWLYFPEGRADLLENCVEKALWRDQSGIIISHVGPTAGDRFRVRFSEAISFDIWMADKFIVNSSAAPLPPTTAHHCLYDQIIPRVSAHLGNLVVHAAAVCHDSHATLLVGESGGGKSTLATSFHLSGQSLLGDDAAVISNVDDIPSVRSIYPSLRLLPDSISALLPKTIATTPVAHYTPKQRIDVVVETAAVRPALPIVAIFVIGQPSHGGQISTRKLSTAQSCMALVESSFALDPSDTSQAHRRLVEASSISRQIPAFEINYPRDFARLAEVRQAILDEITSLEPA